MPRARWRHQNLSNAHFRTNQCQNEAAAPANAVAEALTTARIPRVVSRARRDERPARTGTQLAREPLYAVLPEDHRLAGQPAIDLRDLADDDFVGFSTSHIHDYITRACIRVGFAPRLSLQGPQVHTMIHLVAAGLGVTLAPRCDSAVQVDGVVFRPLDPPADEWEINAWQHRWRRNTVAARLVDAIVRAATG